MNNEPKQPAQPTPHQGVSPSEHDHAEHGIPPAATDAEPTGLPTSDRHQTETTPAKP